MTEQLTQEASRRRAIEPRSLRPREYKSGQKFNFGATQVKILEELPYGALGTRLDDKTILLRRSYRVAVTEGGKTHETVYAGELLDFAIDNDIQTT